MNSLYRRFFRTTLSEEVCAQASVQTTERYIGSKQKLQEAVNDRLEIVVATAPA